MKKIQRVGTQVITWVEDVGLLIIAIATVIAIGDEVMVMINNGKVTLADLLLLFIYMEILTMVSIYLKSGQLPVRMPIYIAIVALARYLILDMKEMDPWEMIAVAASALVFAFAVLVIRFGHIKFPYEKDLEP